MNTPRRTTDQPHQGPALVSLRAALILTLAVGTAVLAAAAAYAGAAATGGGWVPALLAAAATFTVTFWGVANQLNCLIGN